MNKNLKGFAHLILVILLTVAGIGAIGYFAFKNGQSNTNNLSSITSPAPVEGTNYATTWNFYKDPEYNYTINYPQGWVFSNARPPSFSYPETGFPKYHLIITAINHAGGKYDDTLFQTRGSYCTGNCPTHEEDNKIEGVDYEMHGPILETKEINGLTTYYLKSPEDSSRQGDVIVIIPIPDKAMFIEINPDIWPKEDNYKLFDQIVSTFKFLPTNETTPGDKVFDVTYSGGDLCVSDKICTNTITLYKNGALNNGRTDEISLLQVTTLLDFINSANFDKIRSNNFTGTCPTAYDGQEVIYTFYTSKGTERVASCETEIDMTSPLFSTVSKILKNE